MSTGQEKGESGPRLPAVVQNRSFVVYWTSRRRKWTAPNGPGPKQRILCPVDKKKAKVDRARPLWSKTEVSLSTGQEKGETGPRLPAVVQSRRFFVYWTRKRRKWTMPGRCGPKQKFRCLLDKKKAKLDRTKRPWSKTENSVPTGHGKVKSRQAHVQEPSPGCHVDT